MARFETGQSVGTANIDANFDVMTSTPQVHSTYSGLTGAPNYVGAVKSFMEVDSGNLSASSYLDNPRVTSDANMSTGVMTPLFDYAFNGTAQDTGNWFTAFTTMTATVGNGTLLLNANNTATTSTGVYIQSKRYFNLTGSAGLKVSSEIAITLPAAANEAWYFGLGVPVSSTALPTDGVWFQYTNSGLIGSVANNAVITSTASLPVANPITIPTNTIESLSIRIHNREVYFLYNGSVLGSIAMPAPQPEPFMSGALPYFCQYINTGSVSGSQMQLQLGTVAIDQLDSNIGKPYPHIQAGKGLMAYQGSEGGTMGSTALYPNNWAVSAGNAMTNTASTGFVGLGGQFSWQPTLTQFTDGILCSYQNPVGGINQTPRTMYITGIRIQSSVSTVLATGGTWGVYPFYSLAFGHTNVSLATTETASFATASTKAPRRIALGIETFAANAAVGSVSTTNIPVLVQFASPVVVNPGEFVAIAAKNVGNITVSGVITSSITFDSYLE